MDMKKLIQQMTDIENEEKKRLDEDCGCGGPIPAPEMDRGNPVTVNVNMSASGKENVDDLLQMMKSAGLGGAGEVSPDMMPVRQDMERLRSLVADPEASQDTVYASEFEDEELEEYENEPEEEYRDQPEGGGLNRRKSAYKDAEDGDNAMAVKVKEQLLKALSEKKKKPDFLDVDKDGNKKEPMTKAIKDKKSTTKETTDAERNPSIERGKYKGKSSKVSKSDKEKSQQASDKKKGMSMDPSDIAKRKKERDQFG